VARKDERQELLILRDSARRRGSVRGTRTALIRHRAECVVHSWDGVSVIVRRFDRANRTVQRICVNVNNAGNLAG
jgi:hypothetical protein